MLARFDLGTDAGVPGTVARLHDVREHAVFAHCSGDAEALREAVHRADVGMEQVHRFEALAADLGVEVQAARAEPALSQKDEHDLGREVQVRRELVGVPAEEQVAAVGVDAAEHAVGAGVGEFVAHRVPGERRVVRLHVELKFLVEPVAEQERERVRAVEVVLMAGRLVRLRLDEERTFEPDLLLVVHGHVEELREVVEFALEVGVPERHVAFAAAPEDVVFAAEFQGRFECPLHLGRGVGEHLGVGAGAGTVNEARVTEQVRGTPEQLDPGAGLRLLELLHHGVEILVRLVEILAFGRHVAIVKAVVGDAEFLHELEGRVDALDSHVEGIGAVFPGANRAAGAEGIAARAAKGVPVADGEAQVVAHRLAFDLLVRVVLAEGERVLGVRAFESDLGNVGERGHCEPREGRRVRGGKGRSPAGDWVAPAPRSAFRKRKKACGKPF